MRIRSVATMMRTMIHTSSAVDASSGRPYGSRCSASSGSCGLGASSAMRPKATVAGMAAVVPQRRNDAALTAEVNRRLDVDGYAIVESVLSRDEAREIGDEIRRLLDGVPEGRNFFEGF